MLSKIISVLKENVLPAEVTPGDYENWLITSETKDEIIVPLLQIGLDSGRPEIIDKVRDWYILIQDEKARNDLLAKLELLAE